MSQTVEKIKILIASPSDVCDERDSIAEVISELNQTYCSRNNQIIEVVRWETHSAPAASETVTQDIIENDLGSDYDLFIGILWKRFGTPTGEFGSGTEQEFERAYSKFKNNPKSCQILFYFKTGSPTSLNDIDPDELKKVKNFRERIGGKNVLYWEYNTIDDFNKFLRIHIQKRLDELKVHSQTNNNLSIKRDTSQIDNVYNDDLGILDYQEITESCFNITKDATLRIAEETKSIGIEINKRAEELNMQKVNNKELSKTAMRNLINHTADSLNSYAKAIDSDVSLFFSNFEQGVDAFSKMITIFHLDFESYNNFDTKEIENIIQELIISIENGVSGMTSFKESINSLPRMTKELNQAKRNVQRILEELINKLGVSHTLTVELKKNLH